MTRAVRALHIVSGDLWAGAEVQAFTLISLLARLPETEVAAVLMNDGALAEKLRADGVSVFVLDERKANPLRILIGLGAILRKWRPDVVHTHRMKENILGSLANRSFWNAPCVRTLHGGKEHLATPGWRGARHLALDALDRWCGRTLQQRVIAVSRELKTRMAGEFPLERIVVVENGVDFDRVRAAKGTAQFKVAEPDAIHVGIAGRLVAVKRVDLFLGAAAFLLREDPRRNWRFHIFGDGPQRPLLEELAKDMQIAARVTFHGHREDIATCVGGLDALVICSDHEGMPMIALEAAALGVRTVAHAVGGLVDAVPREFLVRRHDAQGYGEGILRALCDDGEAIAGRRQAETLREFSAQRNAERTRAVYREVLDERGDRCREE